MSGRLNVHLVNTSGEYANDKVYVFDETPAVRPLFISIKLERMSHELTVAPGVRPLAHPHSDGRVWIELLRRAIHEAISIEVQGAQWMSARLYIILFR